MTESISEEAQITTITTSSLSLPRPALKDLLSVGVCIQCIFRLFGIHGNAYSSSLLSTSILNSLLEEPESCGNSNGLVFCSVCLGILQLAYDQEGEKCKSSEKRTEIDDFVIPIAELVKREGYQIDGFSIEISIPPIILANERAIKLYMQRKYGSEDWFQKKFLNGHISVKDALKLSITDSLETLLATKSDVSSFRIRLTYTHTEASFKLQNFLGKDHSSKRRKTGTEYSVNNIDDSNVQIGTVYTEHSNSESDAAIYRTLDGLQDHVFCERFKLPPEKAYKPCNLAYHCFRAPIYISGRYLKYSRNVSQTRWIIDDERMGEASVEEIIGSKVLLICRGDNYKFHAAGREDIDVRMLGSGRPFLIEVPNARCVPSLVDIQEIEDKINDSEDRFVRVINLKVAGNQVWTLMREGEAEKQKQYAALVWISRPFKEEDLESISSLKDMDIFQRTPVRVLHRRSPLERKRIIHWMTVERVVGSCQYFLLHLCTQAGTYIKEFVHGDLGRTHPSIGSILGCRAEILQLDVTDVKMDNFN
ncbi:pseudouridine synthase family protein [Tasmannia lanceolata]|uniref:pseudouridine synthase family protein n=1 Tax=Tasmannia lanceolata TaxID=3420 RepID=UPI004064A89C